MAKDLIQNLGKRAGEGCIIEKDEGFTDRWNKPIQKHGIEISIYTSVSKNVQNTEVSRACVCNLDHQSGILRLRVVVDHGEHARRVSWADLAAILVIKIGIDRSRTCE